MNYEPRTQGVHSVLVRSSSFRVIGRPSHETSSLLSLRFCVRRPRSTPSGRSGGVRTATVLCPRRRCPRRGRRRPRSSGNSLLVRAIRLRLSSTDASTSTAGRIPKKSSPPSTWLQASRSGRIATSPRSTRTSMPRKCRRVRSQRPLSPAAGCSPSARQPC